MTVEPTVPNVMWLPLTDPFKGVVPDVERSIVPDSCDPVCVQLSVKVPVYAPL
jgi:hypothetical protein